MNFVMSSFISTDITDLENHFSREESSRQMFICPLMRVCGGWITSWNEDNISMDPTKDLAM